MPRFCHRASALPAVPPDRLPKATPRRGRWPALGGHRPRRRSLPCQPAIVQLGWATEVGDPKSDSGARTVNLDAGTIGVLRLWRAQQDDERRTWGGAWRHTGLVFTREDGSALHPDMATRSFERLYRAAGLPPIRLHDLRHTAASLALQAGVPLKVVSEQLGHSSLAITADTYTSVLPAVAQAAAEAVASIVPRNPRPPADAGAFPFRSHEAQKGAEMNLRESTSEPNMQVTTGGPPGDRTRNLRIKSPLLCQLS